MASAKMTMLMDLSDKLFNNKLARMQSKFSKTTNKMKAKFGSFTREIPGAGRAMDLLTNKWVLLGAGVAGMGLLLNKSVKSAERFDSAFLNIRQFNSDKSNHELDSYRSKIRDAAYEIGSNLKDSTDAMYDLQSATGVYGNDAIDIFKKVGKYSFATGANLGRKMIMTKTTFDTHTTGHYLNVDEQRHRLFPHIKSVLNNPDEVWLSMTDNGFKKKYISFYKDRALVVRTRVTPEKESLEIETWYYMKGTKGEVDSRKGLKIK